MCPVGLLPRPSTALFGHEHPYNSHHLLICRATGCPSCTSIYRQWTLGGGMGKKQECFFFLSQLEIFIAIASHPRHHRPSSGACAANLMATVMRRVFSFSCGQGWHLWQFSLCNLDYTQPTIKLNSYAFPQLSHWNRQLGVCECVNCAVVVRTYRMC